MLDFPCMNVTINKTIPIPARLRKQWQGSRVIITASNDRMVISRIKVTKPKGELLDRLLEAGKKISKKNLRDAITAARR